jgi:hypothetical protein
MNILRIKTNLTPNCAYNQQLIPVAALPVGWFKTLLTDCRQSFFYSKWDDHL